MAEARAPRLSNRLLASVRLRVTALATLAVVAVLVVAGAALVVAQRRQLVDRVDEGIEQRADELAAELTRAVPDGTFPGRGPDSVAQLVGSDGRVVAASPLLGSDPALAPSRPRPPHTVHDFPLETGDYRLLTRRVDTADGSGVLHVAGSLDDAAESGSALRRSLVVGIPLVAAVLAILVWVVVGRVLRRVEVATRAQQRFVADASHELRTPIARMRTELEVDLAHPETADPEATRRSILDETVRLQHLADDLLLLARADAGELPMHHAPLDLDEVVAAECRAAVVPEGITLETRAFAPVQVAGDADRLGRALRNLLDNALRHAATRVEVGLVATDGRASLTVADDGPGIPEADRERVFERFARLDEVRGDGDGGAGLGLAITREIVEEHGGTVRLEPGDQAGRRGTCLRISLPTVH